MIWADLLILNPNRVAFRDICVAILGMDEFQRSMALKVLVKQNVVERVTGEERTLTAVFSEALRSLYKSKPKFIRPHGC